jgi:peptidoglycan/xylan/chitin deacetylase (PgdA/CDA1 family)
LTAGRRLAACGLAAAAGAAAAQAAPAITTWLDFRCLLTPALAGVGEPGHVALTFDDGPDPRSTPAILDGLDGLGWRATFFLLGTMVRRWPALAAEVADRGHEVGVHGDGHFSHLRRTPGAVRDDVERARDLVAETTGCRPSWFRPPYGTLSGGSLVAAHRLGLRPVLWTTWGRDWREDATPDSIVGDVAGGLRAGATVLLHDSDCTSAPASWRATLGALPGLAGLFADRRLLVGPLAEHGIRPWRRACRVAAAWPSGRQRALHDLACGVAGQ